MRINNKKLIKIIDEVSIQKRVKEIAVELTSKFKDKKPIFIGVLNASFIFISDLVRNLNINCEIDFIKVSSYKEVSYHLLFDPGHGLEERLLQEQFF